MSKKTKKQKQKKEQKTLKEMGFLPGSVDGRTAEQIVNEANFPVPDSNILFGVKTPKEFVQRTVFAVTRISFNEALSPKDRSDLIQFVEQDAILVAEHLFGRK